MSEDRALPFTVADYDRVEWDRRVPAEHVVVVDRVARTSNRLAYEILRNHLHMAELCQH